MEDYLQKIKPFHDGLPSANPETRQKRYLLDKELVKKYKPVGIHQVSMTVKRFEHLLEISHLFKHFLLNKLEQKDEKFVKVYEILKKNSPHLLSTHHTNGKEKPAIHRGRMSEKDEDKQLMNGEEKSTALDETLAQDEEANEIDEEEIQFTESPLYINGSLRPYQIQGLNWLISLHRNNLSGILADEMGLGKTLQTISFLGYIRYLEKKPGPFLVIAPKSTLNNWLREFNKWTPEVNAFVLQGDKEGRAKLVSEKLLKCDFDVVIASYEIVIKEKAHFRKLDWEYIVIDEAHRIKNEESLLSQVIREFTSRNRLLITGTPLQNNLHELWALLNFLLPDIFADSSTFDQWFGGSSDDSEVGDKEQEEKDSVVKQLHAILQPFLLRRVKSEVETSLLPKIELDVYAGMSAMQKQWYRKILERDIDAINGETGKKESKTRLLNIMMQLRKCCNHPYLFDGAEPGPPFTTDQHLIDNSAKLKILDKLLDRFKQQGSRVLIFSQMSRVLDILEDYCYFKNFGYCRIDGSTDHEDRIAAIDEYNAPGSEKFVFLLTTRAGGLGINLTSADIVVLYDSDWNPQADLQAMDRAHRIGQKKQVKVFRFVTDKSVEVKILEKAKQKLRLDQLVIQQGRTSIEKDKKMKGKNDGKDELLSMIQHGAKDLFEKNDKANDEDDEFDLEKLLQDSEQKTKELNAKYSKLGLDDLQKFSNQSGGDTYEWDGESFKKTNVTAKVIDPLSLLNGNGEGGRRDRERNANYSIDEYYRDVLNPKSAAKPAAQLRMAKPPYFPAHQFLPIKLKDLMEKERLYNAKLNGVSPTMDDVKLTFGDLSDDKEENKRKLEILKLSIDVAEPLSEEELQEKEDLKLQGFTNWTKNEYRKFLTASGRHGRTAIREITREIATNKTEDDVYEYSKAFWANITLVDNYERVLKNIEAEEDKLNKLAVQQEALRRKVSQYRDPLRQMKIKYVSASSTYSLEHDRFLITMMLKHGLDKSNLFDLIKFEIRKSPLFHTDFFFQNRSSTDINKRCQVLLGYIEKEMNTGISIDAKLKKRLSNEDAAFESDHKKIKN
ncbi:hypothetical protein ACO0RG_003404 [Hanseniaspora osmophila]